MHQAGKLSVLGRKGKGCSQDSQTRSLIQQGEQQHGGNGTFWLIQPLLPAVSSQAASRAHNNHPIHNQVGQVARTPLPFPQLLSNRKTQTINKPPVIPATAEGPFQPPLSPSRSGRHRAGLPVIFNTQRPLESSLLVTTDSTTTIKCHTTRFTHQATGVPLSRVHARSSGLNMVGKMLSVVLAWTMGRPLWTKTHKR